MNALRRSIAAVAFLGALLALGASRPAAASAASCVQATGAAAHVLCFLDLTGYTFAPGTPVPITFSLPDGSTVGATFTNTGTATTTPTGVPTYAGAALGHTAYTGITGSPAFYGTGTMPTTLSSVRFTDPGGKALATTTIAGVDAESMDTGDGTNANITWTTTGTGWAQVQLMNSTTTNGPTPVCTLSGLGTQTATCTPTSGNPSAAYILTTNVTPTQTLGLSTTSTALQGYAFAVDMATLSLAKQVKSRIAGGDQFTVTTARSGTSVATATTTGTNATATTGAVVVAPADTYTMTETASGTTSLASYATTYACTNANASSTTTLPSGSGTTFSVTPAADDMIACTFTNTAMTSTDVPVAPNKNVTPSTSVTDAFTLTNTSLVAGTFVLPTAPTVTSGGSSLAITGYTFNGNTYTTFAALQAAITAAGPTAASGSIAVGVSYSTPATVGALVSVGLASDIVSGTGTSAVATGIETDTVSSAGLTINKTGTTMTTKGGMITYNVVISNLTNAAILLVSFSDPVPTGLTITGTPSCGSALGGATCPGVSVLGNTVSATVVSLPAGGSLTFTITAAAGAGPSYTNTASVNATLFTTITSSLTTTIGNGLTKTVRNVTTNGAATTTQNTAVPGNQLEFVLAMPNTTGFPIHGVTLTDPLPTQTNFLSASCGPLPAGISSCSITAPSAGSSGTVTFTYVGTLANGSSLTATIETIVR